MDSDANGYSNAQAGLLVNVVRVHKIRKVEDGCVTLSLGPFADLMPRFQIWLLGQGDAV